MEYVPHVSLAIYIVILLMALLDLASTDINFGTDFAFGFFSIQNILCIGMGGFWYDQSHTWYAWAGGAVFLVAVNTITTKLLLKQDKPVPEIVYEGRLATTITTVSPDNGLVVLSVRGSTMEFSAISQEEIPKHRTVKVIRKQGDKLLVELDRSK